MNKGERKFKEYTHLKVETISSIVSSRNNILLLQVIKVIHSSYINTIYEDERKRKLRNIKQILMLYYQCSFQGELI